MVEVEKVKQVFKEDIDMIDIEDDYITIILIKNTDKTTNGFGTSFQVLIP